MYRSYKWLTVASYFYAFKRPSARFLCIGSIFFFVCHFSHLYGQSNTDHCGKNSGPIIPPLLQPTDTVAIVAPAWHAQNSEPILQAIQTIFTNWGLKVVYGASMYAKCGQFGGDDRLRAADLQTMLADPTIKAIFAYRGGHGATRIIDQIDFSTFIKHPKWVVGFSDITTIHLKIHQLGFASLHAEMPKSFHLPAYQTSLDSIYQALFFGTLALNAPPHPCNTNGTTQATVVGGNLSIICANIGTDSDIDTKGKILVLEDIDEKLYALDRMIVQLKRTGKLNALSGLIIGGLTYMKDQEPTKFKKNAEEIIKEHVKEFNYPIAFNFPIGHVNPNIAFLHGAQGTLEVTDKKAELKFGIKP